MILPIKELIQARSVFPTSVVSCLSSLSMMLGVLFKSLILSKPCISFLSDSFKTINFRAPLVIRGCASPNPGNRISSCGGRKTKVLRLTYSLPIANKVMFVMLVSQ